MADWLNRTNEQWPYWPLSNCCPDMNELRLLEQIGKCPGRGHLTKEEFLKFFPMFANVPDEWLDMLLEKCRTAFNARIWGRWLKWGEALFVAHYLSLRELLFAPWEAAPDDANGNSWLAGVVASTVTSFRAGSVAYTKDASIEAKAASDPMMQTTFGQQLLDLMRTRIGVGLVMVT